jgi:hypothetical protein
VIDCICSGRSWENQWRELSGAARLRIFILPKHQEVLQEAVD